MITEVAFPLKMPCKLAVSRVTLQRDLTEPYTIRTSCDRGWNFETSITILTTTCVVMACTVDHWKPEQDPWSWDTKQRDVVWCFWEAGGGVMKVENQPWYQRSRDAAIITNQMQWERAMCTTIIVGHVLAGNCTEYSFHDIRLHEIYVSHEALWAVVNN